MNVCSGKNDVTGIVSHERSHVCEEKMVKQLHDDELDFVPNKKAESLMINDFSAFMVKVEKACMSEREKEKKGRKIEFEFSILWTDDARRH